MAISERRATQLDLRVAESGEREAARALLAPR